MFNLIDIPDLPRGWQTAHKIKALRIGDKNPVIEALRHWKANSPKEYEAILKSLRLAGGSYRVEDKRYIVSSAHYPGVYEAKAHRARVFFFYDKDSEEIIICTNTYEKGDSHQEEAFIQCDRIMKWYNFSKLG